MDLVADIRCVAIFVVASSLWSFTECLYSVSFLPHTVREISGLRLTFKVAETGGAIRKLPGSTREAEVVPSHCPRASKEDGHIMVLHRHVPNVRKLCGLGRSQILFPF